MSAEMHSEPVTIPRADGPPVVLKRVRAEDRHLTYPSEFRTARKILLLEDLMLMGVPKSEWGARLDALNRRRLDDHDLVKWVDEPAGQYTAIRLSLSIDNKDAGNADVAALGLTEEQLHEAAAAVLGLRLVPVNDPLPVAAAVTDASAASVQPSGATSA